MAELGEVIVPVLEKGTLCPERSVPCESRPAAELALEPGERAPSPAPTHWAEPKPWSGQFSFKKLGLGLKMQTIDLCSEAGSSKPIRPVQSPVLYGQDFNFVNRDQE